MLLYVTNIMMHLIITLHCILWYIFQAMQTCSAPHLPRLWDEGENSCMELIIKSIVTSTVWMHTNVLLHCLHWLLSRHVRCCWCGSDVQGTWRTSGVLCWRQWWARRAAVFLREAAGRTEVKHNDVELMTVAGRHTLWNRVRGWELNVNVGTGW